MWIFRLLLGMLYDLCQFGAGLSALVGLYFLTKSIVLDDPTSFQISLAGFALAIVFWIMRRIFRPYAI